jgi:hypothetical protein
MVVERWRDLSRIVPSFEEPSQAVQIICNACKGWRNSAPGRKPSKPALRLRSVGGDHNGLHADDDQLAA